MDTDGEQLQKHALVVRDTVGERIEIPRGNDHVLSECTRLLGVDADGLPAVRREARFVGAEVLTTVQTVATAFAGDARFDGDTLATRPVLDARTEGVHHARELVTEHLREMRFVPVVRLFPPIE
nr:hypothetical protein [Halobellus captivus]